MEKLERLLYKELDKIAEKGDITPSELQNAKMAVCTINEIRKMKDGTIDDGYSGAYGYSIYPHGHSYAPNRSRVTGRFMNSRDGMYSRDNSYDNMRSGHSIKDRMISKLESMYDEASSPHEQQILSEWIGKIETEK